MHIAIETIDGHFAKNPFNEFHFHVIFVEKLAVKQISDFDDFTMFENYPKCHI